MVLLRASVISCSDKTDVRSAEVEEHGPAISRRSFDRQRNVQIQWDQQRQNKTGVAAMGIRNADRSNLKKRKETGGFHMPSSM